MPPKSHRHSGSSPPSFGFLELPPGAEGESDGGQPELDLEAIHQDAHLLETYHRTQFNCGICLNYLSDAHEMPCCHSVYCYRCIHQSLSRRPVCPLCRKAAQLSKVARCLPVQRIVDELPVKCPYAANGCTVGATVATINAHIHDCEYASAHCEGCGDRLVRAGEEAHIATCGAVPVRCKFGCNDILKRDLASHYFMCPSSSKFQMSSHRIPLVFPESDSLTLRHGNTTATHSLPDVVERLVFPIPLPAISFWQIKLVGELLPLEDDTTNRPLMFVGVTPHIDVDEINFLGKDEDECAFDCMGDLNLSGSSCPAGPPWIQQDIIGVFTDQTDGFIEFYQNGRLACRVEYDYEGVLYPAVCWQCRGTISLI